MYSRMRTFGTNNMRNENNPGMEHIVNEKREKKNGGSGHKGIRGILITAVALFLLITLYNSLVITHQNEYKLVRSFGKVTGVITKAGLSFKNPFIESTLSVPKEELLYDLPESDVITSDKKTMIVDSYVLWHVTDPLKFLQSLNCSVPSAEGRIDTIVYNATKTTISNMTQDEVIQSRDGKIDVASAEVESDVVSNDITVEDEEQKEVEIKSLTDTVMDQIGGVEAQYGIVIDSVDVKKLDLPDANKEAVYTRMISERDNIAAQYTAEGAEEAQKIKNTTDKDVSITVSNANAQAEKTIAEGEAQYMQILSDAYNDESKADYYDFVRSLDAIKASMKGGNKTVILNESSPIAKIFENMD